MNSNNDSYSYSIYVCTLTEFIIDSENDYLHFSLLFGNATLTRISFRSPFAFLETVTHIQVLYIVHVKSHDAEEGCMSLHGKTIEMVYIMFIKIRNTTQIM